MTDLSTELTKTQDIFLEDFKITLIDKLSNQDDLNNFIEESISSYTIDITQTILNTLSKIEELK